MKEYTSMNFFLLHFMDHRLHGMCIEFIDQHGIIVMNKRLEFRVDRIAKKKWFIAEIDLQVHRGNFVKSTEYRGQNDLFPGAVLPTFNA